MVDQPPAVRRVPGGARMEFDPYAEEHTEDPYPGYAWMRAHDPVHHNATLDVWFLTKYDDVLSALKDPGTFSSERYLFLDQNPDDIVRNMQTIDPPRHDALREMARAPKVDRWGNKWWVRWRGASASSEVPLRR